MMMQWRDVPKSAYVNRNGMIWQVKDLADDGTVTLWRPDLGENSGRPPLSAEVFVTQLPTVSTEDESKALLTLRIVMGATVVKCAWCNTPDEGLPSHCQCDEHCGAQHCINFARPIAGLT